MRNNAEHREQSAFFQILALNEKRYPYLKYIFAVANGGNRNIITATMLKAEGVKRGIWDVCIPFPNGKAHGAFIEFKAGKNKLTPEQIEFGSAVTDAGHSTTVAYDCMSAIDFVEGYFGITLAT
ncbi:MAG: VRR-NUC domain-containing protein [Acidobacteriota bacterium]